MPAGDLHHRPERHGGGDGVTGEGRGVDRDAGGSGRWYGLVAIDVTDPGERCGKPEARTPDLAVGGADQRQKSVLHVVGMDGAWTT